MNTTTNRFIKPNSSRIATALLSAAVLLQFGCTKGGSISGSSSSSISGAIAVTKVYPTPEGENWTQIIDSSNFITTKGLALTVKGTCTRGIDKIKVQTDLGAGATFTEQATCQDDGSWTWQRSFAATTGEGSQTLTFTAYDITDAAISGSAVPVKVNVDATIPANPVVTTPASTSYTYTGGSTAFTIQGTCSADTVKLKDSDGGFIVQDCNATPTWSYVVTLVEGTSQNYDFYSYDLAGNESGRTRQTISWSPDATLLASGAIPGGVSNSTIYRMEGSAYFVTGKTTNTGFDLFKGFNFIVNKARGL